MSDDDVNRREVMEEGKERISERHKVNNSILKFCMNSAERVRDTDSVKDKLELAKTAVVKAAEKFKAIGESNVLSEELQVLRGDIEKLERMDEGTLEKMSETGNLRGRAEKLSVLVSEYKMIGESLEEESSDMINLAKAFEALVESEGEGLEELDEENKNLSKKEADNYFEQPERELEDSVAELNRQIKKGDTEAKRALEAGQNLEELIKKYGEDTNSEEVKEELEKLGAKVEEVSSDIEDSRANFKEARQRLLDIKNQLQKLENVIENVRTIGGLMKDAWTGELEEK